ncbi:MAG: hypothetical protein ABSG72_22585 [Candidatus Sulfotelmatobacter sp.]
MLKRSINKRNRDFAAVTAVQVPDDTANEEFLTFPIPLCLNPRAATGMHCERY